MPGNETLPHWVVAQNGRIEPFDGERIAERIFAATERLGRPNPLLSRELTASVLHFLGSENHSHQISKKELLELIVKFVRELGHANLAGLLECKPSHESPSQPNDVDAAINHGHLVPLDADCEGRLVGGIVRPGLPGGHGNTGWLEALIAARREFGKFVAIDGPEWLMDEANDEIETWVQELRWGLQATGLTAIVNLNPASPPPWWTEVSGPLFHPASTTEAERIERIRDRLLTALLSETSSHLQIHWHYEERDLAEGRLFRLTRIAQSALEGAVIACVPDRPNQPIALADGVDRRNSYVLGVLGIDISKLLDSHADKPSAADFTGLRSISELAAAYGRARRNALRRRAEPVLSQQFRLDRARLQIVPLAEASHHAIDWKSVIDALLQSFRSDLAVVTIGSTFFPASPSLCSPPSVRIAVPFEQWSAVTDVGGATLELTFGGSGVPDTARIAQALGWAWRQVSYSRIRFGQRTWRQLPLAVGW
jgi:hypothetical protein